IRWVIVLVLPVPAPASTQTGPRGASTASRCSSSSPAVKGSATIGMTSILAAMADKPRASPRPSCPLAPSPRRGWGFLRRIPLRGTLRRRVTLTTYDQGRVNLLQNFMVWLLPPGMKVLKANDISYDAVDIEHDAA